LREHESRRLANGWMSIGNRNRPANQAHWTKIIDIIAEIGSTMQGNAVSCQPVAHHGALVHYALRNFGTQLGRAGSDDWVDLLGDNQ